MDKPLNGVAYTGAFLAHAKDEGMSEAEMQAMERQLAADPEAGDLIVGQAVAAKCGSRDAAKEGRAAIAW